MPKIERVPCTRCGKIEAYSAEQLADIRSKVFAFPAFPPEICARCMLADPALKAEFEASIDAYWKGLVGDVRNAMARPLEAIDRFVESLK